MDVETALVKVIPLLIKRCGDNNSAVATTAKTLFADLVNASGAEEDFSHIQVPVLAKMTLHQEVHAAKSVKAKCGLLSLLTVLVESNRGGLAWTKAQETVSAGFFSSVFCHCRKASHT